MTELASFDPVGDFQNARQNALAIRGQEQAVDAEARAAPIRNELNRFKADQFKSQTNQQEALRQYKIMNQTAKAFKAIPVEQWQAAAPKIQQYLTSQGIDVSKMDFAALTPELNDQFIATSDAQLGGTAPPKSFTLSPGQKRFGPGGEVVAEVAPTVKPTEESKGLPPSLLQDVSIENRQSLDDVYEAAGRGKDGIKAVNAQKKVIAENTQRKNAPQILAEQFPEASPEEQQQLQAAVDGGKTVAEGFKAAGKVREKQRQVKKGRVFKERALTLITRILDHPELDDVIGSFEGHEESAIPFGGKKIRGDAESSLIADIEEASNIFTADNLDLMSGVLSETDIKIIANLAAGALVRTRGEAEFRADVNELKTRLSNDLGVKAEEPSPQQGAQVGRFKVRRK